MFFSSMVLIAAAQGASLRPVDTLPELPRPSMTIEEYVEHGPAPTGNCPVPRPSQNQKLVILGFYEGTAVTNFSVAGLAAETTTGAIRLEPGPSNLFLAITTERPVIFRFSGHVERLARVVILNHSAGGVTGIDPGKVSFGIGSDCEISDDVKFAMKFGHVKTIFGRDPDASGGAQALNEWVIDQSLVGTESETSDQGFDNNLTQLEEKFESMYPGGFVKIDPSDLISSQTAERYEILPNTAGAVQLERAGKIVRATRQEIEAWHALARLRYGKIMDQITVHEAYKVLEPIDLPAAMCGGHLLYLLLPSEEYARGAPCHNHLLLADGRMMIADWSKKQKYVERLTPLDGVQSSR